jgi:hypothetical protein
MPRPKPATEIAAEPAQVAVEEPQGSLSLPDARPDNAVTRNIDAELEAAQERARAEGDRRAEESAWSIARGADSIPGYEAYLGAFPNGQHAAEARRWISQRTRAQTPSTQTSAASATYDLALLNPQVRAAVERAREADRRGVNAAARARQAASEAEGFASRARNGESGLHSSSSTWGSPSMTARYEGQISGGVFSGYGVQVHTEGPFVGDHYAGQWRNDQRQGLGVYTFAENASNAIRALRYEGEWVDNDRTGSGVTHWRSLGRYSGGNSGGMKSGAGVFYFPDGRRYEGEWGSDSYNGYGVVWDAQGNVLSQGVWAGNNLSTALSR